jgi:hypothetical protein
MRKASFIVALWTGYEGVPIPDNLKTSKEILEYLVENIDSFTKYQNDNIATMAQDPLYQAIIEDENGNETTITLDD